MPAEAYELIVSGILSGQFVQNVLHVNVDNSGSSNPYTVAYDLLETLIGTVQFDQKWTDALPADYRITSLRCKRVLVTGGPTAILLAGALTQSVGQRTGSIQAAQVNPVIVLLTTTRPNRPGRIFLPGISETDMDDMVYTAGIIAAIGEVEAMLITNFTLDTLAYAANFAVRRTTTAASDDITAARLSPLVGTQRRRLRPV